MKFIKLTLSASNQALYLDPYEIRAFAQETSHSEVVLKYTGGGAYHVKETCDEILELLNPKKDKGEAKDPKSADF